VKAIARVLADEQRPHGLRKVDIPGWQQCRWHLSYRPIVAPAIWRAPCNSIKNSARGPRELFSRIHQAPSYLTAFVPSRGRRSSRRDLGATRPQTFQVSAGCPRGLAMRFKPSSPKISVHRVRGRSPASKAADGLQVAALHMSACGRPIAPVRCSALIRRPSGWSGQAGPS
jgi:hypothetical protein